MEQTDPKTPDLQDEVDSIAKIIEQSSAELGPVPAPVPDPDLDPVAEALGEVPAEETPAEAPKEEPPAEVPALEPALKAVPEPVPSAEPSPPEHVPPELAEIALLRQRQTEQDQVIREMQQKQQAPPTQPEQDMQKEWQETLQYYGRLQPPAELVQAIQAEDPAKAQAAMSTILQHVAASVHQSVMQQVRGPHTRELEQRITQQTTAARQEQDIAKDFYDKYPLLDNAFGRSCVVDAAAEVQRETRLQAWSPALRDAIATRAAEKAKAGVTAYQPTAPPAVAPQQPFMASGSEARAPTTGTDPNSPFAIGLAIR